MTYDKLRYLEQLLSSIYTNGVENHKKEIEEYFQEYYGEDSLVKPTIVKESEIHEEKSEKITKLSIPDDLENRLNKAVKRVFRGS